MVTTQARGAGRRPLRALSPLECALLALIGQAPQAGYDLRKIFADTPFVHFSDSPGAVYPALRELERRGLVSPRTDPARPRPAGRKATSKASAPGRRRRPLGITASGRAALRQWLRAPVTRDELAKPLNTPMLRFAFMEEVLGRKACAAFLDHYASALVAYIAELTAYRDTYLAPSPLSQSGRLAFDSGLRTFQAQLAWAAQARRAFS
jgi:DNA-binding PadR family transcriptional regulator